MPCANVLPLSGKVKYCRISNSLEAQVEATGEHWPGIPNGVTGEDHCTFLS